MAKKDMDALLGNILGSAIIRPQDKCEETRQEAVQSEKPVNNNTPESPEAPWKHFSFICSIELANKVQAIAHKEDFTIRAFMEYVMRQGITAYESKHGKVKKIKVKNIADVM